MHEHSTDFETAVACLQENGFKITNARRIVLETLFGEAEHLNSAEILERVKEKDDGIGRASIYRSLDLFTELGIIHPTNYDALMPRYVVMETNGHHAHLVCSECKRVIDLGDCKLEPLLQQFANEYHFLLAGHLLELYGRCKECVNDQQTSHEGSR